jgi:cation:H+ antiporter
LTFHILIFCLGLVILSGGAELLVRGSARMAESLGISPFIVGATVVAYGTSAPEFMVSVVASFKGAPDIALGNVVGSNLFNTGLILGIVALISPVLFDQKQVRLELLFNIGLTVTVALMALYDIIDTWMGLLLLCVFGIYIYLTLKKEISERGHRIEDNGAPPEGMTARSFTFISIIVLLGIAGLFCGAKLMVDEAVIIARLMGISERIIGLTLVAMGTSLPEMAAAFAAALKKHSELVLGNLLGSNIFNLGLILGAAAAIAPLRLQPDRSMIDFGFLLFNALIITIFLRTGDRLLRIEGAVLCAMYGLFAACLVAF